MCVASPAARAEPGTASPATKRAKVRRTREWRIRVYLRAEWVKRASLKVNFLTLRAAHGNSEWTLSGETEKAKGKFFPHAPLSRVAECSWIYNGWTEPPPTAASRDDEPTGTTHLAVAADARDRERALRGGADGARAGAVLRVHARR